MNASATAAAPEPLRLQMIEKMSLLFTSALGFVAALAWNEAVKATMAAYYDVGEGLRALYAYASLVTLVAVLVTVWLGRAAGRIRAVVGPRRRVPR